MLLIKGYFCKKNIIERSISVKMEITRGYYVKILKKGNFGEKSYSKGHFGKNGAIRTFW